MFKVLIKHASYLMRIQNKWLGEEMKININSLLLKVVWQVLWLGLHV